MRLSDHLSEHFRLTDAHKSALHTLGIETVKDLLYHFPSRFEEGGGEAAVAGLATGQEVSLVGTLEKLETKKSWQRKIPVSEGYLRDPSGRVKLRWFNQPYIARMYADGTRVKVVGRVTGSGDKLYIANPQLQKVSVTEAGLFSSPPNLPSKKVLGGPPSADAEVAPDYFLQDDSAAQLFAVYPETRGVTSLWFRHAIQKLFAAEDGALLASIEDPLPQGMLKKYHLPTLATALVWAHRPERAKDADAARKRFAFEEIFFIQLARQRERITQSKERSFIIDPPQKKIDEFVSAFPFTATPAQTRAIKAIQKDIQSGAPMSRLLEGDVGSGKTAVAAAACFATVETRPPLYGENGRIEKRQTFGTLQAAYMAPTEILAKQHFESFIKYFEYFPINIGLITGSGCYKFPSKIGRGKPTTISRTQLLKWVANGEIAVVLGTHALIENSVKFKHLALVVIDEQHRFGTRQRRALANKEERIPHLLSMTATPIPRTLALTIYGDLDLTLLDEMPPGRKRIITEIVKPDEREALYEKIRRELKTGRQAYVVCPRIDEPDPAKAFALQAKSVIAEAARLKKDIFPEYELAVLHSKMTPKEKDETMAKFSSHAVDILVATSVVEVGVNVPNATVICIEGAERFGLAQLHQLRGRVARSIHQAYCYLAPESRGEATLKRLHALITAKNGFELAEADLMQRGPGELGGRKQWGISDVGMEALKNLKLVEAARASARAVLLADETLSRQPRLAAELSLRTTHFHFE